MRLLGVALLAGVAIAVSGCGASRSEGHGTGRAISVVEHVSSSSRLVLGGHVRITAAVRTPVQAGGALEVTFRFTNIPRQPRKVDLGFGALWLVVRGADGTRYDTRVPARDVLPPYIPPITLLPGKTITRAFFPDLHVRWSGPLRVTPGWDREALPALRVRVITPGRPDNPRTAIADVVAAAGHLLDHCRPQAAGVPVAGVVDAPKGSAPPLWVRCSIELRPERGFLAAQVLVVTSPPPPGARLDKRYELFTFPRPGRNAVAIGWEFVVTRDGARSVDSTSVESTRPGKVMALDWQWTTSGWRPHPGSSRCGGTGGGGGAEGPLVEFVSVCPS